MKVAGKTLPWKRRFKEIWKVLFYRSKVRNWDQDFLLIKTIFTEKKTHRAYITFVFSWMDLKCCRFFSVSIRELSTFLCVLMRFFILWKIRTICKHLKNRESLVRVMCLSMIPPKLLFRFFFIKSCDISKVTYRKQHHQPWDCFTRIFFVHYFLLPVSYIFVLSTRFSSIVDSLLHLSFICAILSTVLSVYTLLVRFINSARTVEEQVVIENCTKYALCAHQPDVSENDFVLPWMLNRFLIETSRFGLNFWKTTICFIAPSAIVSTVMYNDRRVTSYHFHKFWNKTLYMSYVTCVASLPCIELVHHLYIIVMIKFAQINKG